MDFVYLAGLVLFLLMLVGLVVGCDRLGGQS